MSCKALSYILGSLGMWCAVTGNALTRRLILIAAIISFAWVCWYNYDYKSDDQIKIGRLNVMTWVCWTLSLFAVGLWWNYLENTTNLSFTQRVVLTTVMWTLGMIAGEWFGYNVLKVQLKSNYPGLCGFNLMHGPKYLKVYYLTAWAFYLFIIKNME